MVLAALRARRAPAVTLCLLTALAAAAAAAAPWYVLAAAEAVATRHVEAAPVSERVIEVRGEGPPGSSIVQSLDALNAEVDDRLGLLGFTATSGAWVGGFASNGPDSEPGRRQATAPLAYREQACEHVIVEGRCPSAAGEVMMSARTARFLKLKSGDTFIFGSFELKTPVNLKISGLYRPASPTDTYWAGGGGLIATEIPGNAPPDATEPYEDVLLVSAAGFDRLELRNATAFTDRVAHGAVFVEMSPADLIARLDAAKRASENQNQTLNTRLDWLANRVDRDQRLIYVGVPAGASQLLLLCWFALYLAVKYTGEDRRPDIGLLKLRGARRSRVWALVAGQSALPMLIGAALGIPLGYVAARLLAGAISSTDIAAQARSIAIGAAALAVLGALATALLAERKALAADVNDLLRRVPARRRAWRDVADLVIVAVAVAAVYQLRTRATGDPGYTAGIALLAPGLAALAFALIAARAVTVFADRLVPGALRAGRPAAVLVAIYLARRPGVHRLCALLIVTVALVGTAGLGWRSGSQAAEVRAALDVGADRVLTVRAETRAALLAAVRGADPSGRYAMAAVEYSAGGQLPALLVDSTRLAAVARWRPDYGFATAKAAAAALHPPAAEPVRVSGDRLAVEATVERRADPRADIFLDAILADGTGHRLPARLGPLTADQKRFEAPTSACTAAPHCRLVSLAVVETLSETTFTARTGVAITVHRLDQVAPDGPVVQPAALADRARWRPGSSATQPNLVITSAPSGLALTVAPVSPVGLRDPGVYPMDSPSPLASIRATPPEPLLPGDPRVTLGGITVPEQQVATATRLPRLGTKGVLIDLEYADRLGADFGSGDALQVWLTGGAPARVVTALRSSGIEVVSEETIAGVADRYTRLGPPLALRFTLVSTIAGLALAAGALAVVAAVERRPRAAELAALRAQGAPAKLTQQVASGGYLVLIGVSLVLGAFAAVVLRAYAGDVIPFFADGWTPP
jgi:hypothetical protein